MEAHLPSLASHLGSLLPAQRPLQHSVTRSVDPHGQSYGLLFVSLWPNSWQEAIEGRRQGSFWLKVYQGMVGKGHMKWLVTLCLEAWGRGRVQLDCKISRSAPRTSLPPAGLQLQLQKLSPSSHAAPPVGHQCQTRASESIAHQTATWWGMATSSKLHILLLVQSCS